MVPPQQAIKKLNQDELIKKGFGFFSSEYQKIEIEETGKNRKKHGEAERMCAYCLSETFFLRTWTSLVAKNALQSKDILHQIGKYLSWIVCKAERKKYRC